MIETWLSYDLSDLLMFSPRVYYRQLELANAAAWPLHIAVIVGGLLLALCMASPSSARNRIAAGMLAAAWVSSAWLFLIERYTEIHLAGAAMSALFLAEAAILVLLAIAAGGIPISRQGTKIKIARNSAGALVALVTLAYPLLSLLSGRSLASSEVFAIAPNPTALVTLLVVTFGAIRWHLLLAIPPWLWLAFSASTLWPMGSAEVWPVLTALVCAPAISIFRIIKHRPTPG